MGYRQTRGFISGQLNLNIINLLEVSLSIQSLIPFNCTPLLLIIFECNLGLPVALNTVKVGDPKYSLLSTSFAVRRITPASNAETFSNLNPHRPRPTL